MVRLSICSPRRVYSHEYFYLDLLRMRGLTAPKVLGSCSEESYSSYINIFYGLRDAVHFAMLVSVLDTTIL